MEIEDVSDIGTLFDFVAERMGDDAAIARFGQALNMMMIRFQGRYLKGVLMVRGTMEIPQEYQQPGDPKMWDSVEAIINISESENPGFHFGLDERGMIKFCITRDAAEPIDRRGAPPGSTIH